MNKFAMDVPAVDAGQGGLIPHDLGTTDVVVVVWDKTTQSEVIMDVRIVDDDHVVVSASLRDPIAAGQLRIVVAG